MPCPFCQNKSHRNGSISGRQRFKCFSCKKSFYESPVEGPVAPAEILPDPAPVKRRKKAVYQPQPERRERILRMVEMRKGGKGPRTIARELGMTPHAVSAELKASVVLGLSDGVWPEIAWSGGRPKVNQARKPVEGEGLLRAMRHVLVNTKGYDQHRDERASRSWFEKDPKGFLLKLHDFEFQDKALASGRREGESDLDPGSARCLQLIERLLADAKAVAHAE